MNRTLVAVGGVALAAAVAVGSGIVLQGRSSADSVTPQPDGDRPTASTAFRPTPSSSASPSSEPLSVLSVSHAGPATAATDLGAVTVTFSAAVGDLTPTLSPALAGSWSHPSDTTVRFTPTQVPLPGQRLTVTVPAGSTSLDGARLAATSTTTWTTRAASPARLQQLLGETGYLPLTFTPSTAEATTATAVAATAYAPVAGTWSWRFSAPSALRALYTGATSSVLTRAGVLSFQSQQQLGVDGVAGPQVWSALTTAAAQRSVTGRPYTYVLVSKESPESLRIYRNGSVVLTTPANTGVSGARTPAGSWPVYLRYRSQTMSGTNPDGTHYTDPGIPWISYFYGGDAVHGFPRASYGSPQSVGCVELPISSAARAYALMDYGDIVTVQD